MHLDWCYKYAENTRGQLFEFLLRGVVCVEKKQATLYYEAAGGVGVCSITKDGVDRNEVIPFPREACSSGLPYSDWFITEDAPGLLVLGRDSNLALDRDSLSFVTSPANSKAVAIEREKQRHAWTLGTKKYVFGEYVIAPLGAKSYVCYKNSGLAWKLSKCKGYLYTPIELFGNNRLFWGTDGYGGAFYIVNLFSGSVETEIPTGGTSIIVGSGSIRYVLLRGKKSKLAKVDLESGTVLETVEVFGSATDNSQMFMMDGAIYVSTFTHFKNGSKGGAWWNRITV